MSHRTDLRTQPSNAPILWLLWLAMMHTVPSPFFLFVVAGTAPAMGLLAVGCAGLFTMDSEGPVMGLVIAGQGLAYALVYYFVAWLLARLLARTSLVLLRTFLLSAIVVALLSVAVLPVYGAGGHGGETWLNIFQLLEGYRLPIAVIQYYTLGLLSVLIALLVMQATGLPSGLSRLPSPIATGSVALLAVLLGALWTHRATLVCAPAAAQELIWAQICVARASRDLAEGNRSKDAEDWYRRAAAQGSLTAMRELLDITHVDADRHDWLPVLAAAGDPQAAADYWRWLQRDGDNDPQSLRQARAWLVIAADDGHGPAALEMARVLLEEGELQQARGRFEQAASLGEGDAMRELAWRYAQGAPGFALDLERAAALYNQLSEGMAAGKYKTRQYTLTSAGYRKLAEDLRADVARASGGDIDAMLEMAERILDSGHPGEAGRARALELLERAASLGSADAQFRLGQLLVLGHRGFTPDHARGRSWWNEAVAQNHVYTLGYVAEAHTSGRYGYDIDFEAARDGFALLVEAYSDGTHGVEADPEEAARWQSALRDAQRKLDALGADYVPMSALRKQAETGDAPAQYQLGVQLQQAYSRDHHQQAVDWWVKAAAGGYAPAQFRLVPYYLRGDRFVKKDIREAVRLLQGAARSNHLPAMYELGLVYEKGRHGVARDLVRASEIYQQILGLNALRESDEESQRILGMAAGRLKAIARMQDAAGGGS